MRKLLIVVPLLLFTNLSSTDSSALVTARSQYELKTYESEMILDVDSMVSLIKELEYNKKRLNELKLLNKE